MKALDVKEIEICPWALREARFCAGSTNLVALASVSDDYSPNCQRVLGSALQLLELFLRLVKFCEDFVALR